jgi:hypothetical protein
MRTIRPNDRTRTFGVGRPEPVQGNDEFRGVIPLAPGQFDVPGGGDVLAEVLEVDLAEVFGAILASFRALQLAYQQVHWQAQGDDFYQEHLLAERLYDEVSAAIDEVAEKGIAATGSADFVAVTVQLPLVLMLVGGLPEEVAADDGLQLAFAGECMLNGILNDAFAGTAAQAGVNDLMGALADAGLQRRYLLARRLGGEALAGLGALDLDDLPESVLDDDYDD